MTLPTKSSCPHVHKVLILENELGMGGLEKKLYDFVARIDKSHYRVTVCCFKHGGYLKKAFVDLGTPFYDRIQKHKYDIFALGRLMRILQRERIDLLYTVPHPNALILSHLAKLTGRVERVVVSIHGTGAENGGRMFRAYQKPFLSGVDRFIAVANSHGQYLSEVERLDPSKIEVIHNGVDLEAFAPGEVDSGLREELGVDRDTRLVTTVATLKPLKRIDLLLEAARAVLEDTHDVRFVIVGEGGEHDRLASRAASLGIADHVVFTGFRTDVGRILRSSDLFVLPSRTEAFPNVVLEAMASGLPVVATDVGSVGEMVEDGRSGVMVPAGDVGALQEAVKALLGDTERMRAFGDRGRKIVEEKYTLEQMCSKREALFSELLCRKSSGPS